MTPQKKKFIVVLNEEEYNLHEGRSAAKDGPNLSPVLDSDSLWIAPSHDPLFYKGDIVRVWSLLLIGFRRIPQRILPTNLLQLSRLVEKLILSLLLVRFCNRRRATCVVRVAAVVFSSSEAIVRKA